MGDTRQDRRVQLAFSGLGLVIVVLADHLAQLAAIDPVLLRGAGFGLIGGGAVGYFFTAKPRQQPLAPARKARLLARVKWAYLAVTLGLALACVGLAGSVVWSGQDWVLQAAVGGSIVACLAGFPLTTLSRAALTDDSLNDELAQSRLAVAYRHGFNTMFLMCLLIGGGIFIFGWTLPTGTCVYGIAVAGAFRQMLHLTITEWKDPA